VDINIQEKKIILKNFETECSIGIHDFEKKNKQRVLINIEVHLVPRVQITDDIESVLDYDFMRQGILETTRDRHFNLQETLCYEIVQFCLSKPQVSAVR
jgi:dihydroneopterin aldolase